MLALVLTPAVASAQGAATATAAAPTLLPPPGGGTASGTGGAASDKPASGGAGADTKSTGNVGGVSFNDKPVRRIPTARVLRRAGPLATFPGFEQLPDGGSRLFVQLSQHIPVEERRSQGSITYVLRGARLRVGNDANALVTVHFNTPVFRARLSPQGNDLLFILELRAAATPTFKVNDNQDKTSTLQIDFAKGDFISGDGTETLPRAAAPGPNARAGKGKRRQVPANSDDGNNGDPNGPTP